MYPIPLLLLPGTCNDVHLWAHQSQALADIAECHVADLTHHDNIADMADAAVSALPPGPFAMAGFSLGGYVALEVMRRHGARVCGLALVNSSARAEHSAAKPGREQMMASARSDFAAVTARLVQFMLPAARHGDMELVDGIRAMMARVGADVFIRQSRAVTDRADSRALLPAITCPALVISGSDDQVAPARFGEEMATAMAHARWHVLADTGHFAPLEQPQAVTQHMREWLERAAGHARAPGTSATAVEHR